MGPARAGWRSYDRIANGGEPSADRIVGELHTPLKPGDKLTGLEHESFHVMAVEENRYPVLGPQVSWTLALYPQADGTPVCCALVKIAAAQWESFFAVILDVGDFIMMREQALHVKARAERQSRLREAT